MEPEKLYELCRLCATQKWDNINLFEKNYYNKECIADFISKNVAINLENDLSLPSKICTECYSKYRICRDFFECILNSQETFYSLKPEQKADTEDSSLMPLHKTENQSSIKIENDEYFQQDFDNNIVFEVSNHKINSLELEFESNESIETNNLINSKIIEPNPKRKLEKIEKLKVTIKNQSKNKNEKFPCTKCNMIFLNQKSLTKHLKGEHLIEKLEFRCDTSEKTYTNKNLSILKVHKDTHLPSDKRKPLSCPHCDEKFTSYSKKCSHLHSVHDIKKKCICEACGEQFFDKHYLTKHKLSHTSVKNMQCPHCPARFKSKTALTAHMEIHGESYPCSLCGALLNTKILLKRHMIVHSDAKEFKCNFCQKEYKRDKELYSHLVTHIGLKPFECKFCDQKFAYSMTLHRHFKSIHPTEYAEMIKSGQKISNGNFPPIKQLKAINEAAKNSKELNQ